MTKIDKDYPIFIASLRYKDEIRSQIEEMGLSNRII
jgi:hypothetical protein